MGWIGDSTDQIVTDTKNGTRSVFIMADHYRELLRETEIRFTTHDLTAPEIRMRETIREQAKKFAEYLIHVCPSDSHELRVALTHLDETVMWANAGIARKGARDASQPSA